MQRHPKFQPRRRAAQTPRINRPAPPLLRPVSRKLPPRRAR